MSLGTLFTISKGTRVVLSITISVSILAVLFAFFYYRNLNKNEDPRIKNARELLVQYEKESVKVGNIEAFTLLDSADSIFRSYPDYVSSFETGLIYNNKCSAMLLMALYDSTVSKTEKTILLDLAMKYCDSSIVVYNRWISAWGSLSSDAIAERIKPYMNKDNPAFYGMNYNRVFARRVKNIATAQIENPRRLSVSLSNRGTIYRHKLMADSALSCYRQALILWKENRTAKSNMSVLMGGEPVKPSLLESLFPPDKNKI